MAPVETVVVDPGVPASLGDPGVGRSVREQAAASGTNRAARAVKRVRRDMASSIVWRRGAWTSGAGRKGKRMARRFRRGRQLLDC